MAGVSGSSVRPDGLQEWPPGELDETVFRSIAEGLAVPLETPPGQDDADPKPLQAAMIELSKKLGKTKLPVEKTVATLLDTMVSALGENWIGGPWDPKVDIRRHTTSHLDSLQSKYCEELAFMLRVSLQNLLPDGQIRQLLHVWWQCFNLWDRSLAYRTIPAATAAVAAVAKDRDKDGSWGDMPGWQQEIWCAVGGALQLLELDQGFFAQTSLACAGKVISVLEGAIPQVESIRDDLGRASQRMAIQLEGRKSADQNQWEQKIQACVSYMWIHAAQMAGFYKVISKMATSLQAFEAWLAKAGQAERKRSPGMALPAFRQLSLNDAPRASLLDSLEYLEETKSHLSSHILSEIEPWEQLLVGLLDHMPEVPYQGVIPEVLIPRKLWVRYCFPFAVQNNPEEDPALLKQLLRAVPETTDKEPGKKAQGEDQHQPATPQHQLSLRLKEELVLAGLGMMKVAEPVDLAQTEFFQVGTGEDGHFGGIRIDLPDLMFAPEKDFLANGGHRPYRVWLDLNSMGNSCLCVEAAEPLTEIPPDRLYRALRAGTPFVYGEPITLAGLAPPEEAGSEDDQPPQWDSLHMFARSMIRAVANAFYYPKDAEPHEQDEEGRKETAPYVRANLHEVIVVQTDAVIDLQSEEIATRLDNAVGGRILLHSLQRASATLEEWTRFPPLQRSEQRTRGAAVVAVPEIGYAGDWFVHTGETTVFGIVAVPAWFRDVYFEVAQFASSWSPVLQLWSQHLQDVITLARNSSENLQPEHTRSNYSVASDNLRKVEYQVRDHLAKINAEDLCATLAYRGFLEGLLDAVGVGRLQKALESQLQAAEQMTDYFYQRAEQEHQRREQEYQHKELEHQSLERKAAQRRDVLLFLIAVFGVFGLADFLALLNTTPYHARVGWPDVVVLILFGVALVGGGAIFLWPKLNVLWGKLKRSLHLPDTPNEEKKPAV